MKLFAAISAIALTFLPGAADATSHCAALAPFAPSPGATAPNLAGVWDFESYVNGGVSTGEIAIGPVGDGAYAGSITPAQTNTLAITRLTTNGGDVRLAVWSPEGEVVFEGKLADAGKTMCGVINYHGGQRVDMIARQRPNDYRDNPPAH